MTAQKPLILNRKFLQNIFTFFEFDDDSLDKYEMLKYRQIGKKFSLNR